MEIKICGTEFMILLSIWGDPDRSGPRISEYRGHATTIRSGSDQTLDDVKVSIRTENANALTGSALLKEREERYLRVLFRSALSGVIKEDQFFNALHRVLIQPLKDTKGVQEASSKPRVLLGLQLKQQAQFQKFWASLNPTARHWLLFGSEE